MTDRNSPNENEGEKISPSKRGATGRCTTTERPLTTKAKDSTTPFPRKSLKRVASIAASVDAVGAVMKAVDSPLRRLEAFRLLEDLSLDVHNFYRELMNDFRCK